MYLNATLTFKVGGEEVDALHVHLVQAGVLGHEVVDAEHQLLAHRFQAVLSVRIHVEKGNHHAVLKSVE